MRLGQTSRVDPFLDLLLALHFVRVLRRSQLGQLLRHDGGYVGRFLLVPTSTCLPPPRRLGSVHVLLRLLIYFLNDGRFGDGIHGTIREAKLPLPLLDVLSHILELLLHGFYALRHARTLKVRQIPGRHGVDCAECRDGNSRAIRRADCCQRRPDNQLRCEAHIHNDVVYSEAAGGFSLRRDHASVDALV